MEGREDFALAQDYYRDALRADGRNALAHLYLAQQLGNTAEAKQHFTQAAASGKGLIRLLAQRQAAAVEFALQRKATAAQKDAQKQP